MLTFSAALLAGGKSTRMGRDKALLPIPGYDFLWQRQLAVLQQLALLAELQPARIFWSGHPRSGIPRNIEIVPDPVTDAGPLAGICGCLQKISSGHLLVLAVDLPAMTAPFLRRLLQLGAPGCGVVPRLGERFEPLAALYPAEILPLAQKHLAEKRYRLQEFVSAGIASNLLRPHGITPANQPLFRNLNRPENLNESTSG